MTRKTLDKKIESLGGTLEVPSLILSFPETLKIKTKSEAVDLLDIFIYGSQDFSFECISIPHNALRLAIKRGLV